MRRAGFGATAALLTLLAAAPLPPEAVDVLRAPATATSPVEPLVAVVALLAWALTGWLLLLALLTVGGRLPGLLGVLCSRAVRRIAPAAVRRAVAVALGLGVALGTGSTALAAPAPAPGSVAAAAAEAPATSPSPNSHAAASTQDSSHSRGEDAVASLDWPGVSAPARSSADSPGAARPSSRTRTPTARPRAAEHVVVQAGDTLWGIAASQLPAGASDAEVAQAWPAWWSANRQVIGEDPDLLHPGQHLRTPDRADPS